MGFTKADFCSMNYELLFCGNVGSFGIFVFQFTFYFLTLIFTYQFLIHDN